MVPEITVIAEHSVCLDLLPPKSRILDAGCRGFDFTDYFRDRGHIVCAIDIDDLGFGQTRYLRAGLSTINGKAQVSGHKDPQARQIINPQRSGDFVHLAEDEVYIFTFAQLKNGKEFDLVKLDIEGEEVPILEQNHHPMAKQVSVEFHAHCTLYTRARLDALLDSLEQFYTIHNRVWESRHGAGFNYWDVLLIAK